jgi:Zn-dependent M28 family amino/carboxypeptidase
LLAQQQQTRLTAGWAQSSTAPTVMIRESAVITQVPQAGEQLEMVRGAPKFMAVEVPDWQARLTLTRETLEEQRAPNVVGILPGSDPVLKNEYVVYSAHMDHVGTRSPRPGTAPSNGAPVDSIWNGADDDASGTVGVIELAEAFSRPGVRPKRSVVFLTVSGEEKGLWGSDYFGTKPPMPITSIVANLNADMIGRNWKDTIVVIGKEHSDLGATLASVTAKHPELRMAAIDDLWPEQNFYQRSDHYHFARRGVPVLFFFSGTHPDYHQASDTPDKIDAEKLARIAQMMYWTGLTVANAAERPKWNPESYTKYVK